MYKFPIFLFSPVFRLAGNTARCLLHCARSMFRCALGRPDACKAGMDLAHDNHDSMSTIALESLKSSKREKSISGVRAHP